MFEYLLDFLFFVGADGGAEEDVVDGEVVFEVVRSGEFVYPVDVLESSIEY